MPTWLNEADVRELLSPTALIAAMEEALAAYSGGRVTQPVRTVLQCGERSFFASMPVSMPEVGALGAKLVTIFPGNAALGKPTHLASIAMLDPATGELLALMDGRYITEVRTAAVSAVSLRYLARPEAKRLALLGSGVQARSHLEFLRRIHPFEEVRCWSPHPDRRRVFAESLESVLPSESAREAVEGADVVVLATASQVPVIESAWVRPGTHVIAVGACVKGAREMDSDLVARARLIVDSRAAALKEADDVTIPIGEGRFGEDHIAAELGEVISGARRGRTCAEEVTVFKSLGLAVEDIAAAQLVYREAVRLGRGSLLR